MIHILWGLLNLFLFVFFIKALYHSVRILNKELSRFSLFVLLLGLVSYACRPGNPTPRVTTAWENGKTAKMISNPIGGREFLVEDRLTYTRKINYSLGEDSLGKKIIAKAFWTETGLEAFTERHLTSFLILNAAIDEDKQHPGGPTYRADVSEEWYLLGAKVFTSRKQYMGEIF